MLSIFSCVYWPSICFFWRNFSLVFCPFFDWVVCFLILSYIWTVCIFWRWTLCQLLHLQIFFSHSEGCLFILFIVSFALQKLLSLIRSHLFIFVFITVKNSILNKWFWDNLIGWYRNWNRTLTSHQIHNWTKYLHKS